MPAPRGVDKKKWADCVHKVKAKGGGYDPYAVCSAALENDKDLGEESVKEAIDAASHAALQRGKKKKECKEAVRSVIEMQVTEDGRQYFPVTIITEGMGNLRDKNYYLPEAIQKAAPVYEGKQAYYDHPSESEEAEQPNRTINKLLGHYEDVKAVKNKEGLWELQGKLYTIPGQSRADATEALEHAVQYKKKYPDKDFVGISINGDGEGETMEYDDFIKKYSPPPKCLEKLKEVEGQPLNAITRLTNAFSADVVTAPGAGGKINTQEQQRRIKMAFLDGLKNFFRAQESGDVKAAEDAVKNMLQDEGEDEKKEGESEGSDSLAKKMLQMMKKEKKQEGESEDEYEARLMKQVKKELEAYMGKKESESEDEDESESEKKESENGDDDGDADDKDDKKDKKEKKKEGESEDEDEKKEKKKESEDDDGDDDEKDHPDAAKDKALIKKMMKKQADHEAKMDEMSKELAKYKESAALANTEITIKKREQMIDAKLAECGYRREITKLWKPVLESCKTEKEMDEKVKLLKESAAKVNAERFYEASSIGLTEKAGAEGSKNDDLFNV